MTYQAPLDDIRFTLHRVVGVADVLPEGIDGSDVDAILEEAGKFAGNVIAPLNGPADKSGAVLENGVVRTAPGFRDAYHAFVEGGWNSVGGDPDFGGQGLPIAISAALSELWNSGSMAFALCPLLNAGAIECLQLHGSPAQKEKYLAKMIEGSWTGTMNLTEPQAGSDLAAVRTKAVPAENGLYRITGQKIFITYGDHDYTDNIIHLVLARLPDAPPGVKGISLFVVPKIMVGDDGSLGDKNDLRCVGLEHKLGIHASPTAVMAYGDGEGALGELVGEANRGLEYMFVMMNNARLNVGVQGIGIAERAYQHAVAYARTRTQGKPLPGSPSQTIIAHPDVKRMLLLSKVKIEAARALALEAAAVLDRAHQGIAGAQARGDLLIPIVKSWSTDLGVSVASTGVQVHGGMGFIEETGAAQHLRDARIAPIYEGTNGIQAADLVGRKLLRDGGAAMTALIADIDATLVTLKGQPGDDIAVIAANLADAKAALREATDWLLLAAKEDMRLPFAASAIFLDLAGIVAGGWMLARAALAAQADLAQGGGNAPFLEAKLISARIFAEHELVRAGGLLASIRSGSKSLLAYDEALL